MDRSQKAEVIKEIKGRFDRMSSAVFLDFTGVNCVNCRKIIGFNERQPEHRIADWLCRHACSFVLFDTKARATVIGFEREEDADAFRREFVS